MPFVFVPTPVLVWLDMFGAYHVPLLLFCVFLYVLLLYSESLVCFAVFFSSLLSHVSYLLWVGVVGIDFDYIFLFGITLLLWTLDLID